MMKKELGVLVLGLFMSGCPADNSKIDTSNYSASAPNYSAPTRPDDSNVGKTELLDLNTPEKAIYTAMELAVNEDPRYQEASTEILDKFEIKEMKKLHKRLDGLREIKRQERNGYETVTYRGIDDGKEFSTIKVTRKLGENNWKVTD